MRNEGKRAKDEERRTNREPDMASILPVSKANARLPFLCIIFFALLSASSCGYHVTPVGGIVPESAKTIAIPGFINGTNEPYVDVEITRAVVEEFLTDGRLQVASLDAADVVLRGRVVSFEVIPLSYTVDSYVQQYMVNLKVNVSIEEAKTQKVLWQERGLSTVFVSSYPVSIGNITATKIVKDGAIKNASKDLASTLRSRVLDGF
jgi:hypothetical protein